MSIWTAASDLDWYLEAGIIRPEDEEDEWDFPIDLDDSWPDEWAPTIDDLPPPRTEASEP